MSKSPLLLLQHISDKVAFILLHTTNRTYQDFYSDDLYSLSVERAFEIIGEATKRLPTDLRDR